MVLTAVKNTPHQGIVADLLREETQVTQVIPTYECAIQILQFCMHQVAEQVQQISGEKLEKETGFLWARKLDYTYDGKQKSKELEYDACKAAAYLLVDQILFYHLLSEQVPHYPPLMEMQGSDPHVLKEYFDRVLVRDYLSIFDFQILPLLPKTRAVVTALNSIIRVVKKSRIGEVKQDILGKIFHGLIPWEIRRHLSAFYTSNEAAALLAHLSIDRWDVRVIDLACGSGTLLTEAYIRKQGLAKFHNKDAHREILAQIFGNDVTKFSVHLATINLALQGPLTAINSINISNRDGFEVSSGTLMAHDAAFRSTKPQLDGTSDTTIDLPGGTPFDIAFMNPPFTQHKRLDGEEKQKIWNILEQEGLGTYLDGRMGLHALFILHADTFLERGGKMALVLPSNTFSSNYGKKILQLFRDKRYSIEFLIERIGSNNAFSEQCGLKEYLLVVSKGTRGNDSPVTIMASLSNLPSLSEVPELAQILKDIRNSATIPDLSPFGAHCSIIPQETLLMSANWYSLFQQQVTPDISTPLLEHLFLDPAFFSPLTQSAQISVRRGFDGTHIEELSLPNATWEVLSQDSMAGVVIRHNIAATQLTIPPQYLVKSFRLPRLYGRVFCPGPNEFLLSIPPRQPLSDDLARYVAYTTEKLNARRAREKKEGAARARGVQREWFTHAARFKCENRIGHLWMVWKFNIKTRRGFGFYAQEPGTAHNAFYQLTCENPEWEPLVAAWLNSSLGVYQLVTHARSLTSQYHQLMIEDVKHTHFPLLNILGPESTAKILAQARALDREAESSFRELFIAGKMAPLDRAWLEALGLPATDITAVLRDISAFFQQIFSRY